MHNKHAALAIRLLVVVREGGKLIDMKGYTQTCDFGVFRFPYTSEKLYSVESDSQIYTKTAGFERDPSKNQEKNVSSPGFEHASCRLATCIADHYDICAGWCSGVDYRYHNYTTSKYLEISVLAKTRTWWGQIVGSQIRTCEGVHFLDDKRK